jgi:hypothetical protein
VLGRKVVRIAVAVAVHMVFVADAAVDRIGLAADKVLVELPAVHMAVVWEVGHIDSAMLDRDIVTEDRAKTSVPVAAGAEADYILMMCGRVMESRMFLGSEVV